ncbi:MAG: metal-dependent transcriptional regulator [Candidatus Dormibacteria bacterium]|jgi:DtxR family Mn-dependent transcriptional regulator
MAQLPAHEGAHLTETAGRYLEAIYYIAHEGDAARPGGLADWLGVSRPTVTVTLQRLARDGWVEIADDRSIGLTPAGEAAASDLVRRHRILERWLVDVLGLDWAAGDREASLLVHGVSDEVVNRLDQHLDHPRSCPHGNPIPGRGTIPPGLVRLDRLPPGETAEVVRISEVAEHEAPQLLRLLHEMDVTPGRRVTVRTVGVSLGVEVEGHPVALDRSAARAVWVAPVG